MPKRIALFGGSFNPPGKHHQHIARELAACGMFDDVVIVPCGPRPDKLTTNDIEPIHRAAMVDLTFQGIPNVRVELFDLEQATFTRTYELEQRFAQKGEVWHVVGPDLISDGQGSSFIVREWEHGKELWETSRFVIPVTQGTKLDTQNLPPNHRVLPLTHDGRSTVIREAIFRHQPFEHLLTDDVAAYIRRHALYRGKPAETTSVFTLPELRILLITDRENAQANELALQFRDLVDTENPNCIVVIGGDGMMLRAIRQHWRKRLPFFGINAGHHGFLLNAPDMFQTFPSTLTAQMMPLLYVTVTTFDGDMHESLAFNDAWVERASGQSAWIRVSVNGAVRIPKLIADGVLTATAAGSTAYARAMGATPLPASTPALVLVGSNVLEPSTWKMSHLPITSEVTIETLEPLKRPMQAYVDGEFKGAVATMSVRTSRIAAAELLFLPGGDMGEKLTAIQFPR